MKGKLEQNGLLSLFLNEYPHRSLFIHNKLFKNLVDQFHQNALATIGREGSKLRTYSLIKTQIGIESYLTDIKHVTKRIQMTKFRISNHSLMIEVGRYLGIETDLRFCPFCKVHVETEIHFLMDCPIYEYLRKTLFQEITRKTSSFVYFSKQNKFSFLLTRANIWQVSSFILKCF